MIPVIDIFAGPGGLNEGLSQVRDERGNPVFDIRGSYEMESRAVETLTLRAAQRRILQSQDGRAAWHDFLQTGDEAALRASYPDEFAEAAEHVTQIELGPDTRKTSDERIREQLTGDDFVLVGGPPCQAYSLVGRARRTNDKDFYEDKKHFLFKEYLHILEEHRPAAFVMENVKGLLSARHGESQMFDLIKEDLELEGEYRIRSLVVDTDAPAPDDFVIRSERFGVPQKRHRVILLGLRHDVEGAPEVLRPSTGVTLRDAIGNVPALRSTLSAGHTTARWEAARAIGLQSARHRVGPVTLDLIPAEQTDRQIAAAESLQQWLQPGVPTSLHDSRRHMELDVARYAYYAAMLEDGLRPRVNELPAGLRPTHKNVSREVVPFSDRFWVQAWDEPSSTIVSHLGKDGHHFIHPDPAQARSLSVREAARLQTFPDDYWFCGPRTAQFQQVGNAVPPRLAHQIGEVLGRFLASRDELFQGTCDEAQGTS